MFLSRMDGLVLVEKAVIVSVPGAVILGRVAEAQYPMDNKGTVHTLVLAKPVFGRDISFFQGVGEHETSLESAYGDNVLSAPVAVSVDSIIYLTEAPKHLALLCAKANK